MAEKRTVTRIRSVVALACAVMFTVVGCAAKNVTNQTTEPQPTNNNGRSGEINATTAYETPVTQEPLSSYTDGDTFTGRLPMGKVDYVAHDPLNMAGLSTEKIGHSHGPASNGKAHPNVVSLQKTLNNYGALTLDTVSAEKVLYLTFDCGWENNNLTSRVLDVLEEKGVPAAFFCTLSHVEQETELITRMINEGHIVGNHSTTHPSFASITRQQMADEIETMENYLRTKFGYCSKYFRFPAGEYNESALELISSLGYTSVFWSVAYDDWDVNVVRGADYATETVMKRLHPGAVILLHSVSKDNADALGEIIDRARAEGYTFLSLDDYSG